MPNVDLDGPSQWATVASRSISGQRWETCSCPVGTYAGVESSTWSHIRSSDGSVGPKHSGRTCTLLPYTLNHILLLPTDLAHRIASHRIAQGWNPLVKLSKDVALLRARSYPIKPTATPSSPPLPWTDNRTTHGSFQLASERIISTAMI